MGEEHHMGISNLFGRSGREDRVHYECRECGENLGPPADCCPVCGGGVSRYDLT